MRSYSKLCALRVEKQTDGSEPVHCLNANHLCNSFLHCMSKEGQDLSLFVCLSASVYLLAFCVCVLCVCVCMFGVVDLELQTVTFAVKSALLATE